MKETKMLTWADVFSVHRRWQAVSHENDIVRSILSGSDFLFKVYDDESAIDYYIPSTKGYSRMNIAMTNSMKLRSSFTVFKKISPNVWQNIGLHIAESKHEKNGFFIYKLKPYISLLSHNFEKKKA